MDFAPFIVKTFTGVRVGPMGLAEIGVNMKNDKSVNIKIEPIIPQADEYFKVKDRK